MIRRPSYFPDDLPHPKAAASVEKHYLQCGCIVNESSQDNNPSYANYGNIISYVPSPPRNTAPFMKRSISSSSTGSSPLGSPPRSASPGLSESGDEDIVRIIDSGFCERSSCHKSSIFNKEWNRIWELNNAEMKQALEDTNGKAYEDFKARIRKEAQIATEAQLRAQ